MSFDFQTSAGTLAEGFTLAFQNNANTFVGAGAGGLGYAGIGANAVAVSFDTSPGQSSTGLYLGDANPGGNDPLNDPTVQGLQNAGINLNAGGAGIDFSLGHNLRATLAYDGTRFYEQVIDLDDPNRAVFQYDYGAVDLASQLGDAFAWVGFTAATGSTNERVDVKNWVYSRGIIDDQFPPSVISSRIDDGSAQRSQVKSLSVMFDVPTNTAPGAMKLIKFTPDANGTVLPGDTGVDISSALNEPTSRDGGFTWTWTFKPGASDPYTEANASLKDGVYQYVLGRTKVTGLSGGTMSADFTSAKFHRLFGDINGNKTVNNADFTLFRATFLRSSPDPLYNSGFDYENNGTVNNADFAQFRKRFQKPLTYS
jgi:hypothetical protein